MTYIKNYSRKRATMIDLNIHGAGGSAFLVHPATGRPVTNGADAAENLSGWYEHRLRGSAPKTTTHTMLAIYIIAGLLIVVLGAHLIL
jgi:hypothetical protein